MFKIFLKNVNTFQTKEEADDDERADNPAYIPRKGQFYLHDLRTSIDEIEPKPEEKPDRKSRADRKWEHDMYDERMQRPKTKQELLRRYGHDIRSHSGDNEEHEEANEEVQKDESKSPRKPRGVRRGSMGKPAERQEERPRRQVREVSKCRKVLKKLAF